MKRIPVIIDTDPGIDDAAALIIALRHPGLDNRLITTVAGNVSVDKTTLNALRLVSFLKADVPVARGMEGPLLKDICHAADVHGESGMDGYEFPAPQTGCIKPHAVEALRGELMNSEVPVTLVTIAALTNIAVLITMYPQVKGKIKEIVMMGGSLSRGNTNTVSEFNIFVDPHAAKIVLSAGIPVTMVPLDVTRLAKIQKHSSEQIRESGELGHMLYSLFQHYRGGSLESGLIIHDACAVAYLLQPELFKTRQLYVDVVCEGAAAGALVADGFMKLYADKQPNVTVCTEVNEKEFEAWFVHEICRA